MFNLFCISCVQGLVRPKVETVEEGVHFPSLAVVSYWHDRVIKCMFAYGCVLCVCVCVTE